MKGSFKKIFMLVMSLVMFFGPVLEAKDLSKFVILHTNDTHGFDQRAEGILGMATVAAVKKDYEAKGYQVLLVDGGDAIQDNNLVNFSQGASAIEFMNAVGYDAMAAGNHEFDYGQDVLLKRVSEAKFPILATNIEVNATKKTLLKPYTIVQKGNVKVGIIGITTPETKTSTNPKNVAGLTIWAGKPLYAKTQKEIDYLRSAGCDVVMAVAHLGSSDGSKGIRSNDLAANVKGLDIIVDGHDHQVKNLLINNTLIAETGCYTKNIGKITWDGSKWNSEMIAYNASLPQEPTVKALIDKTALEVKKELGKQVGVSKVHLDGNRAPGVRTKETNLGDFIADAYLWQGKQAMVLTGHKIDGAIVNGGSIRASLPQGKITKGSIQQVLPYNNQLYVMTISGHTLLEVLEASTCVTPKALGSFPQVAGITMTINTSEPYVKGKLYEGSSYYAPAKPGSRVVISAVGGKKFNPDKMYNIVVTEFQCNGGDAYGALKPLAPNYAQSIGYVDAVAVENYLQSQLHGVINDGYKVSQNRIQ